jgi:hypothetical protein
MLLQQHWICAPILFALLVPFFQQGEGVGNAPVLVYLSVIILCLLYQISCNLLNPGCTPLHRPGLKPDTHLIEAQHQHRLRLKGSTYAEIHASAGRECLNSVSAPLSTSRLIQKQAQFSVCYALNPKIELAAGQTLFHALNSGNQLGRLLEPQRCRRTVYVVIHTKRGF